MKQVTEPVLPSLQAPDRRHAEAISVARKNRLKGVITAKKRQSVSPYHSS
jgi:hypothetical protein